MCTSISLLLLAIHLTITVSAHANDKLAYWSQQRKGANCQNEDVEPAYWRAAASAGIEFIRLIPDQWETSERDFLIGSADNFERLNQADLATLIRVLDDAEHEAASTLVSELAGLPLALEQAGAYILANQTRFQDYLTSYRKQNIALLNKRYPKTGSYTKNVATTWVLNFQEVERQ